MADRRPIVVHLRRSLDSSSEILSSYLSHMAYERGWVIKSEFYADALPRDQETRYGGNISQIVRNMVDAIRPAGFIVEFSPRNPISSKAFCGRPVVYVDSYRQRPSEFVGCVGCDNADIVKAASNELLSLGYPHYAYVRWFGHVVWSVEREREFRRIVRERGLSCHVVDCPKQERNRMPEIVRQIVALPKPCAVFAVNDFIARYVIDACTKHDIKVPEEVAVIGVDNNESICEHLQTTLSSVTFDVRHEARAASELLGEMLDGACGKTLTFGSAGVIRRASTRVMSCPDPLSVRAAEFVRLHFSERIGVVETAAAVGCSPATLQRRFTLATGHAVGEEIANVRFEAAKRLLVAPGCMISSVANRCGYDSDSTLRYVFKSRLGVSPRVFAAI